MILNFLCLFEVEHTSSNYHILTHYVAAIHPIMYIYVQFKLYTSQDKNFSYIMLFFQIKNDVEAEVLCMTAIGNIKLQQGNMEETKVQFTCTYSTLYFIILEFDTCE